MDRKTFIAVAVCVVLLIALKLYVPKFFPAPTPPAGATNVVTSVENPAQTGTNNTTISNPSNSATGMRPVTPSVPVLAVNTNKSEELVVLTNEDARYTFTSYGGGLKMVELLHYPEIVSHSKIRGESSKSANLNAEGPAPVLAILGDPSFTGDGLFTVTKTAGGNGVRAEKSLPDGLTLVKEWAMSTNYLVSATVRFENRTGKPVAVPDQNWSIGSATPMSIDDTSPQAVGVMWYNGAKSQDMNVGYFGGGISCIPREPRTEYAAGDSNVVWAAVHNQFFALVVMPEQPALRLVVHRIDLTPPSEEDLLTHPRATKQPRGCEATIVYPGFTLQPNQAFQRNFQLFAGPKEYRTLAQIASRFNNNLDLVMGFGAFFGVVTKALLLTMNWMHEAIGLSYGWAIIAITVIIRGAFWPLTQASTRSMKRMQAFQPQMKAMQEKYKDDPTKLNKKMMEFMKENKVNPMGGCLPVAIQMPVFFGFLYMIRSAIELRGVHFLWVADLSKPDTLFIIPGINMPFNLLPLLMGATMLWQAHLTPPSPGMDPMQQKIMRYMPLLFMVFLYWYSAALTLYWTTNNLIQILQTKLTRAVLPGEAKPGQPAGLTPPGKKGK